MSRVIRCIVVSLIVVTALFQASSAADRLPFIYQDGSVYVGRNGESPLLYPGYTQAACFHEGFAALYSDSTRRYRFIDTSGLFAFQNDFYYVEFNRFSCGLAAVQKDSGSGLMGYIDHTGNWAIPDTFGIAGAFDDHQMAIFRPRNSKHYGWINTKGEVVIPAECEEAREFNGDYALVRFFESKSQKFVPGVIDRTGKLVFYSLDLPISLPGDGIVAVGQATVDSQVYAAEFYRLGDSIKKPLLTGIECLASDFLQLRFSQGRCPYQGMAGNLLRWGVMTTTGEKIVAPKYAIFSPYDQDRAWGCVVDTNGSRYWECIDLDGKVVLSTVNGHPITMVNSAFTEGHASAYIDGLCSVRLELEDTGDGMTQEDVWIDRDGNVVAIDE